MAASSPPASPGTPVAPASTATTAPEVAGAPRTAHRRRLPRGARAIALGVLLGLTAFATACQPPDPRAVHIYHPVDGRVVPWNSVDLLIWSEGPGTPIFSCDLNGAAIPCHNMTSVYMSDGPKTLVLTGTWSDGYVATATAHFTVDGPKLTITSPTPDQVSPSTVPVEFSMTLSDDPDVWTYYQLPDFTYTCQFDADSPVPCTSPTTQGGLSAGQHTLKVVATDQNSQKRVTASTTFTVGGDA